MNQQNLFTLSRGYFLCHRPLRTALLFACWLSCLNLNLWAAPLTTPHPSLLPAEGTKAGLAPHFPPPAWTIDPTDFQFNMNMVVRIRFDGTPDNTSGNVFGVFVGNELRGVATSTNIGGQLYYFVTAYSNNYTGEVLTFRTYYAPNDKVYASPETIVFTHHKLASTIDDPFWVNIDPDTDFPPELSPIPNFTTLQTIPFDPVVLTTYLNSPDGDPVTWSAVPGANLTATIVNGVMTVTPVSPAWTGTDIVTVKVTENTPNQYMATQVVQFTVLPDYGAPTLAPVPNQTIFPGETFTPFDLDNYLTFNGPCRMFDFDVFPYTGTDPDPAWPTVPPGSKPMSIVARVLFADEQLAGPSAKLAAFVNNTLVGTASPTGTPPNVSYTLSLKNVGLNPITFRFYHAENQFLYEKVTTLAYVSGGSVGSVAAPYEIQLSPLVPKLGANGTVEVNIADPNWLGTYPVDFIVWDCDFPNQRRDTVRATFSVVTDNRPRITSPATVVFQEKACYALYDAQSTDPAEAEGSGLTYSLAGGADLTKFSIDPVNGKLSWAVGFSPDFEVPADANTDNQYEVIIRVTNSMSISDDLTLTVTVTDNPVENFQPQVNGGVTAVCLVGTAVLQASGGNAYNWNSGDINASITVTSTGMYTVTVTNDVGCSAVITVTVTNRPTITATGSNAPVCLGSNISLGSTPAGGSGTYTTFAWAGPNSFTASVEDPAPFPSAPAAAGTYTVTVTDNAGCTATATTALTVAGTSAPAIAASNNGPVCLGVNLVLTSVPSGGSTIYTQFKWAGPNNYSASAQNPAVLSSSMAAIGTYTVTVTDNAGCTATGTTAVLVKPNPTISAVGNSPLCVGANVMLSSTPSGGSGTYTAFAWAGPNFTSALEDPATFFGSTINSGTYTVTVTDNAGCTATATTVMLINGPPTITAALLGPVCTGGMVALSSTPAGGSGTYSSFQWSGPNSFTANVEDPAAFAVIPAVAGTYTVTVTDNAGCAAAAIVMVAVHPAPTITAANTGPICEGSNLALSSTPSGGTLPYALFQWTGPDNYVASIEDPAAFSTTTASSGIYQVKITDIEGCTATASTTANVNVKPSITATSNSPVCMSGNIHLQSTPSGGSGVYSAFNWSGPNSFANNQEDPPGIPAISGVSTGAYRVTVTDNAGCTATASTSVAVSSNPAPVITPSSNGPVCGGSLLNLMSAPSGGSGSFVAFQWTGPNGYTAMGQNPAGFTATALSGGVYRMSVTDSKGCIGTNTLTVVVNAPKVEPAPDGPVCEGSTVVLQANPSGSTGVYNSFAWAGPNGPAGSGNPLPSFVAGPTTVGTYTVTVTDNVSCTASATVAVNYGANQPPSITCPADQNTFTVGNTCTGAVGNWVGSETGVMDDCTASGAIVVTQMPSPLTPISGHDTEVVVTLTADDQTGNTMPCTFKVILKDNRAPTITCPADQTVAADEGCSGMVGIRTTLATNLTDNCAIPGAITVSQMPAANTGLSGHNDEEIITLTADDQHGNTTPCTFKVILKDVSKPVPDCPDNIVKSSDPNLCSAVTTYAVTVSDNCTSATVALTGGLASGAAFPVGVNTVTWTATDVGGNTETCQFTVTVNDIQVPSIVCPQNLVRNTDPNLCTAIVTYASPSFSDNCPGASIMRTGGLPSGGTFPKGVSTVNWKVTDGAGLTAICNFTVTVNDAQMPSITCPSNIVRSTSPGLCSAVVTYSPPTSSDNCPGVMQVLFSGLASGSIFPKGPNSVIWQATDEVGLTKRCTFTVTVNDTERPVITCPPNQTKTTDPNLCTAITTYTSPTFTDNCPDGTVAIQSGLISGSPFPKGITTVVWRATDASNNTRTCTFRVTVNDLQVPVITCPGNIAKNTDPNLCTAVATYTNATFTDNCTGGSVVRFSGLPSGSAFPKGSNSVVFRATDASGNTAQCTMTVTVTDVQVPTITCPSNISVTAPPGQCSMVVTYATPPTSDNCSVDSTGLTLGLASGSVFPQGVTTNIWKALDNSGLSSTCTFTVTVACGTAPEHAKFKVQSSKPQDVESASSTSHLPTLNLQLSPNPATTQVRATIAGVGERGGELLLLDPLGRTVLRQPVLGGQQSALLDWGGLGGLPSGLYQVRLRTEGGVATKALVVMAN